jgi:Bacterial SH3 domain
MRAVFFIVTLALLTGASSVSATSYCEILSTRDGFVALRDGPSASAKLIRRMKTGETVQIDSTAKPRGGWMKVFYTGPDRSLMQPGWVSRRLVERECG